MKNLDSTLVIALLFSSTQLFAQVTPKKEFTVSISEKNIELKPGETKTFDVTINRSKTYSKVNIDLVISSTLPEGLTVTFEDGENPLVNRKMVVAASSDMDFYSKTVILKGKSLRASKGVMLNLSVTNDAITSK